MGEVDARQPDLVSFAIGVLDLLERGKFTATYKYAVLLGLIDLCMEHAQADGTLMEVFTTRQLARNVTELYWPHTGSYKRRVVLRQSTGGAAEILAEIQRARDSLDDPDVTFFRFSMDHKDRFEALLDGVESTLIRMPLPRLQTVGQEKERLLYEIGWDDSIGRSKVRAYQQGDPTAGFDNSIRLLPGVAENLVALNGLLRPLIHREWAARVARLNKDHCEGDSLEGFLFGVERIDLGPVRAELLEVQSGRCFYCHETVRPVRAEVDHFIPWARFADNGIFNLVVAHERCNNAKRNFIASVEHLERWVERNTSSSLAPQLAEIATHRRWEADRDGTMGVARSTYLRLKEGARLWRLGDEFVRADPQAVRRALRVA
jgi:hypothetical protein